MYSNLKMEYINKIKEACANHIVPDIVWVEAVEDLVAELGNRKAASNASTMKYAGSQKGRAARAKAQKAYYHREKAKKEQKDPEPPPVMAGN